MRERKKTERRAAIVKAARRLFRRKGFDRTTVDEIAERADISRRTFFRYFSTKEAVVFPNNQARLEHFERLLAESDRNEPPFEAVRRACGAMAAQFADAGTELLEQHRIIEGSRTLVAYEIELDRTWEVAIERAVLRGGRRTAAAQRHARIVAGAMAGVIRASLRHWFAGECRDDVARMGDEALEALARGLLAKPRPKQANRKR